MKILVAQGEEDWRSQFRKVNAQTTYAYAISYDYTSVMHYKKNAGAKSEGLITIETKNKNFQVRFYLE